MAAKARTAAEKVKRQAVKEEFDLMTSYLNQIEEELTSDKEDKEVDLKKIAMCIGKMMIIFTHLAGELEIYEKVGK